MRNLARPFRVIFELLRIGRHFWVESQADKPDPKIFVHVTIGRNRQENKLLENMVEKNDVLVLRTDEKGPTALVRYPAATSVERRGGIEESKKLIFRYSKIKPKKWSELDFKTTIC